MRRVVIEISGTKFDIDIPESWNEVPESLYPELARLYVAGPERMNEDDKLVRVFCLLAVEAWDAVKQLENSQLYELLPLVHWVFDDLDLTLNKIREIFPPKSLPEAGKKKSQKVQRWLGPADGLDNLRFGEFCMAETYFVQYTELIAVKFKERDVKACEALLDKLVATLYRPVGVGDAYAPDHASYRGDRREKYNSALTDDRAKLLAGFDPAKKDGIFLFYASARAELFRYFPNVFKKSKGKGNGTKTKDIDFGWLGVFDDLLGEKGRTAESLEDEYVSTVLMSLERGQQRYKESNRKR